LDKVVEAIYKKYWKELSKKKNVGYFSGTLKPKKINNIEYHNRPCFKIYVTNKQPLSMLEEKDIIPKFLEVDGNLFGYYTKKIKIETDVEDIGYIVALNNKKKFRPIKGGISSMHYKGTACTLNGFFKDKKTNKILVASNNHCYALENKARKKDIILQPSPYDGGTLKDKIGTLYKYVPIVFNEYKCLFRNFFHKILKIFKKEKINKVDIAFSTLEVKHEIKATYIRNAYNGKRIPEIGEEVRKTGRTTELTRGKIIDLDWYGYVTYSRGKAFFGDCILVEGEAKGGDSGSPVFDKKGNYVGALFAGSNTHYIVCKFFNIEKEGEVELVTK
jgi:hypothetical protein